MLGRVIKYNTASTAVRNLMSTREKKEGLKGLIQLESDEIIHFTHGQLGRELSRRIAWNPDFDLTGTKVICNMDDGRIWRIRPDAEHVGYRLIYDEGSLVPPHIARILRSNAGEFELAREWLTNIQQLINVSNGFNANVRRAYGSYRKAIGSFLKLLKADIEKTERSSLLNTSWAGRFRGTDVFLYSPYFINSPKSDEFYLGRYTFANISYADKPEGYEEEHEIVKPLEKSLFRANAASKTFEWLESRYGSPLVARGHKKLGVWFEWKVEATDGCAILDAPSDDLLYQKSRIFQIASVCCPHHILQECPPHWLDRYTTEPCWKED